MAELLKYIYNNTFFDTYCSALSFVLPSFESRVFRSKVETLEWEQYELKQRMRHLSIVSDGYLPTNFKDKVACIDEIIKVLRKNGVKDQNLEYIFLADIITLHGLNDLDISIKAIEVITQFTSFEFAGRSFIIKYPDQMMSQMMIWAKHKNATVRRFASEGCRPRLPWGLKLQQFVDEPKPVLKVLDLLMNDPSEYVRKSVANNLNDISKDHPDLVIDIIKKWKGKTNNTDWILKHASRTLLKKGHHEVLDLFGTSAKTMFEMTHFDISLDHLTLGDTLTFEYKIVNKEKTTAKFRLEYVIHFVKSNGQRSKKIFKIAEPEIGVDQELAGNKKHKFIDLTTRKHYPGTHKIAFVVNGLEDEGMEFDLKV